MSAVTVTDVVAAVVGTVASLAIVAVFVGAIVLSKRDYTLTGTVKLAPRSLPRQSPQSAPVSAVPDQRRPA